MHIYPIVVIALTFWCFIHFCKNLTKWKNKQIIKGDLVGYRYIKPKGIDYLNAQHFTPVIIVEGKEIPYNTAKKIIIFAPEQPVELYKEHNAEDSYFQKNLLWTGVLRNLIFVLMPICIGIGLFCFKIDPANYGIHLSPSTIIAAGKISTWMAFSLMISLLLGDFFLKDKSYLKKSVQIKTAHRLNNEEIAKIEKGEIVSFDLARRHQYFKHKKDEIWIIIGVILFMAFVGYFLIYQKMIQLGYI